MRRLALILWLALVPIVAADSGQRLAIPSWIELTVPAGFSVSTGNGRVALIEEGALRTPLMIEVLKTRPEGPPKHDSARQTPGGQAPWSLRRIQAAGSGGDEWILRVDHPLATIIARQQREFGQPDFARVWQVADSFKPVPAQ